MRTNIKDMNTIPPIKSSNVERIEYDPEKKELKAQLKSGTYIYKDVPQRIYDILEYAALQGQSVGSAFNKYVVKGGFKYERA